jgi:hypothetical protein
MKTKNTKALERHHLIWVCKYQAGIRGYILQISDKKNLLVCTSKATGASKVLTFTVTGFVHVFSRSL